MVLITYKTVALTDNIGKTKIFMDLSLDLMSNIEMDLSNNET